jgi:hypothetical protein
MANLGFGINVNEYAEDVGYDQYSTSLGETLIEVAKDTWTYNPSASAYRWEKLEANRNEETNEPILDRQELNKKYSEEGLFFETDEKQSTVDILLERKRAERLRRSIIERGPEGSWNPFSSGFYVGAAKFGTGLVTSIADPINIAAAFVPVVGQARFAGLVAKMGFTGARLTRGAVEGAVGTAIVEPLIYSAAKAEQADYGLRDSFMNVTFGTIFGGGLHVGAGKLKDWRARIKFDERVSKAREDLDITSDVDPEFNLYKEYYPETSPIMMALEKADPETRRVLLVRALSDLMEENPVEVRDVANLDPALNEAQAVDSVLDQYKNKTAPEVLAKVQEIKDNYSTLANLENKKTRLQKILDKTDPATKEHQVLSDKISKLDEKIRNKKEIGEQYEAKNDLITEERKGSVKRITQDEKDLNDFEQSSKTEDMDIKKYDMENSEIELQLEQLKARQKESFDIADDAEVTSINEDINDFNKNRRQIKDAIIDGINCVNNK